LPDKELYNEKELLRKIAKGNEQAFAQVYHLFVRQLFYFIQGIVKNEAVAQCLTSETFMKAYQRAAGFPTLSALKSFLMTTGKNAALDFLRTEKGHASSHQEIRYLSTEGEKDVEQQYIASQLLQQIYLEIENLPPQCREVIRLSLLEDKSIEEISAILHIAYKSVQNQKTKGMQLLRNALLKSNLLPAFILYWGHHL